MEVDKIYHGNNIDILKTFPDDSIDSVVTDPPYGISFMNKHWDYDVPTVELWEEVYRVLKPGGHMLVACGTRTQHRMAVNIEDAGFEIRDIVAWIYGSGFPKSLDISKQIDKRGGKQIAWFGKWLKEWREDNNIPQKEIAKLFPSKTGGLTGCVANWELGLNMPTNEQFNTICQAFDLPFESLEEAEREIIGKCQAGFLEKNNSFEINNEGYGNYDITAPSTDQAKQYQGWGTALKPAMELWTLARKPTEGTIAENVLMYGTGGINIDGCRIPTDDNLAKNYNSIRKSDDVMGERGYKMGFRQGKDSVAQATESTELGRFPANVIHDGSEEVVELFPNENDISAARFFYCPKASKEERNMGLHSFAKTTDKAKGNGLDRICEFCGASQLNPEACQCETKSWITKPKLNIHPTVKPIDLMRYLCRLITPKDGIVLDPYVGSGSTAIAAKQEKFHYIGIEQEKDYVDISEARIKATVVEYDIFDFI